MKCLDVFAVNTMDISFVFKIPELVPSTVSLPRRQTFSTHSTVMVQKASMKGMGEILSGALGYEWI